MKDLLTVVSTTLIGLVAFVVYLSYATKLLFFVALAYLTYSFLRYGLVKQNDVQSASIKIDDARLPVA